ncbi:hypothetical protein Ga0074812_12739 [Parafrankia irregularis]|uniref:Uncharacterized protein n=1 Tax=Parafrankia irregularis TaxID=795642 RepID=A0A0S4QWI7_9ACTN|nr:hypothetical protein Ga0074812_12739 [Parafrankia irregularis]
MADRRLEIDGVRKRYGEVTARTSVHHARPPRRG